MTRIKISIFKTFVNTFEKIEDSGFHTSFIFHINKGKKEIERGFNVPKGPAGVVAVGTYADSFQGVIIVGMKC